jgi:hypothetical protein
MYDKKKISTEKNSSELLLIILILPGRACWNIQHWSKIHVHL